ncbi:MAG TPA: 4Fe-4S binding protein, partial [Luteolibacter sp.]|nr:4Fe-4S binding protein [Luteolibacter sp.]
MKATAYRRTRIAVGALVLGFATLAFADVGGWLSAAMARIGLWPQFAPSLLAMMQGFAWIAAGCLVVLLLTLLFGRIYCAMLCPLGVLMDVSAWLARRTGKKRKLAYREGKPRIRAAVVVICAAGLLAGTALPLAFLDPYSVFGKIAAATARPLAGEANNLLSTTGWLRPAKWSPVDPVALVTALVLLGGVVAMAVTRGRLWCNTLCPVGAVLGFFSRRALFRLQISDSACVGCSMCERVCPAQCIDFRNHRIDHSRCVMCLDCVTSCKRSGIQLRMSRRAKPPRETAAVPVMNGRAMPSIDRRLFLAGSALVPGLALAGGTRHPSLDGGRKPHSVLPPGARTLKHFQSRCTACHLCVANCPDQVLRPSITAHGLAGFLQPYQDFSVSFCSYNCSDCSQVCPTGAIETITIEERRTVRTGVARFFQDLCVVETKGTPCGACNEHCPTQAVHMVPWKNGLTMPEVDPDLCIGCGGCEFICPVRPHRAIVVDGLPAHERAKPVDRG